jgi:hypothetical protein
MNAPTRAGLIRIVVAIVMLSVAALARGDMFVVSTFGIAGGGDGQLLGPTDVAANSKGDVLVADQRNNRIQQFKPDGKFVRKWGTAGPGDGQFSSPSSVAVDGSDNVYVGDPGNSCVQKFGPTRAFPRQWSVSHGPQAIAVAGDNVYVISDAAMVQKFTTSGAFVKQWPVGVPGTIFPSGVAVDTDPAGNVYVSQSFGPVTEYTSEGVFVQSGSPRDSDISGITVDPRTGDVWTSINDSDRLVRMSAALDTLLPGPTGLGSMTFAAPQGLGFDCRGNLNVADFGHNRVVRLSRPTALALPCGIIIVAGRKTFLTRPGVWFIAMFDHGKTSVKAYANCLVLPRCDGSLAIQRSDAERCRSDRVRQRCELGRRAFRLRRGYTGALNIPLKRQGRRLVDQSPGLPVLVEAD